jgi:hypothetical protein
VTATAFPTNETPIEEPLGFDARMRRVLELRQLVRRGQYVPDPHEVAAAILAERLVNRSETEPPFPPANNMGRFIVPPMPPTTRDAEMTVARTA